MSTEKFQPGQSAELEAEVTKDLSTNRMSREGADVLSTPGLLLLMENACIKESEPSLPEGYTTVGYGVDGLRHLAPTAMGQKVRIKAVLTGVDGNRLTYSLEAFEGDKKIGVMSSHKRAVISTEPEPL